MTVVSDSSPLITFARIGHFELLLKLFGRILVPADVYAEVVVSGFGLPGANEVEQANWIEIAHAEDGPPPFSASATRGLGKGELAAIRLAKQLSPSLLLVDEHRARRLALSEGLAVQGCIGILETLHRRALLHDLRGAYLRLLAERIRVDIRTLQASLSSFHLPAL